MAQAAKKSAGRAATKSIKPTVAQRKATEATRQVAVSTVSTVVAETVETLTAKIEALREKGRASGLQSTRNLLAKQRRPLEAQLKAMIEAEKATKATEATKVTNVEKPAAASKAPGGTKGIILEMIQRPDGASEAEVCARLNWKAAGATIGRAIKLAPLAVRKEKGADGRMRYIAAA